MEELRVRYVKDEHEVTAILVDIPGTNDPNTMTCYSHIGQHSICSISWYRKKCVGATPEEYINLHVELQELYSDYNIIVVGQIDTKSYQNRLLAISA